MEVLLKLVRLVKSSVPSSQWICGRSMKLVKRVKSRVFLKFGGKVV
jgi:hypothetical protein